MGGDALGTGLTVAIFADSVGVPSAQLVTFSTPKHQFQSSERGVLADHPFVLAANQVLAGIGGYQSDLQVELCGTVEPEGYDLSLRILVEAVPELSGRASGSALALARIALALLSSRSRRKARTAA